MKTKQELKLLVLALVTKINSLHAEGYGARSVAVTRRAAIIEGILIAVGFLDAAKPPDLRQIAPKTFWCDPTMESYAAYMVRQATEWLAQE